MKRGWIGLIALLVLCQDGLLPSLAVLSSDTTGRSSRAAVQRRNFGGREYVRGSDWVKAHNLQLRWIKREESLEVSDGSVRIGLAVDSQEAEINGVQVRLLFPILYREGQVYLSEIDARATFEPILFPMKGRPASPIKNICLDPGHG